ncbi:hypothetical protein [Methanomethylophilus alvi]|uniref:hypothetical protein n=1 Tax=Methanomethylophilus alvi TaxID=1291540 RepID=UPI0037DDC26D
MVDKDELIPIYLEQINKGNVKASALLSRYVLSKQPTKKELREILTHLLKGLSDPWLKLEAFRILGRLNNNKRSLVLVNINPNRDERLLKLFPLGAWNIIDYYPDENVPDNVISSYGLNRELKINQNVAYLFGNVGHNEKEIELFKQKYGISDDYIIDVCWHKEQTISSRGLSIKFGNKNKTKQFYVMVPDSELGLMWHLKNFALQMINTQTHNYEYAIDFKNYPSIIGAFTEIGKINVWNCFYDQPTQYSLNEIYQSCNVIIMQTATRGISNPSDRPTLRETLQEKVWEAWTLSDV